MYRKYLFFSMMITLLIASCGQAASSPTSPLPEATSAPPTSLTHTGEPLVSNEWAYTSIQWVQGGIENKLFLDSGGDVDTEVVSVGSPPVEAQRTGNCQEIPSPDGNTVADCSMQFRIDDSVLFAGSPTTLVRIEVEYYDQGTDSFFIQYDAAAGAPYGDGTINETELVSKTDSGSFKTAIFTLEDAYFANRINGADFRIDGMDDGAEIIRSVTVTLLKEPGVTADIIFYNGNVITMEEIQPIAEAIAIQGDKIMAVGEDDAILALKNSHTKVIDLEGLTLMPGFIDPHSHVVRNPGNVEETDMYGVQEKLLQAGVTTIADMGGDRGERLEELLAMESSGDLRVRVSQYLWRTTNCGEPIGDWYLAYPPTRMPGALVQVPGIKIFTDGGSCGAAAVSFEYTNAGGHGDLYFSQEELNQIVAQASANGYQAAIHATGDVAIEQALMAIKESLVEGENILRHRIEHNTLVRPDMYPLYSESKPVALIFGPYPTCALLGEPSKFQYSLPPEVKTWEWPNRELIEANPDVVFAWHEDTAVFPLDPMLHLYGFVTRRGGFRPDGSICEPPDWFAANAIPVETALKLMTINSAYALFREDDVGSLGEGKFADLIILSDNPLAMDPNDLIDIEVLMTMVNGNSEYCSPGYEDLCP